MVYRLSRTTDRGQHATRDCFIAYLGVAVASGSAWFVDAVPEPGNDGGPNDRTWVLWKQAQPLTIPAQCDPGLQSDAGKNGWETEAEARSVLKKYLAGAATVAASVAAANKAAVSPANIASGVASDVAKAAADVALPVAKTVSALWLAEAALAAVAAYVGFRLLRGR